MDGAALPEKLTHNQLAADLAAHMRGMSSRVTWEDMQLGPSGSPRPDVYTMEPTYTRMTFEAFEVKVSVSDFRRDVTAGKWQSYLKYANSVTFAVPVGLVTKDQVPASCGLILRSANGKWRYAKKPTRQVLAELPWQAWVKLLLDGVERTSRTQRLAMFSEWAAREKLAKKYGAEVAGMLRDLAELPQRTQFAQQQHDELVVLLKKQRADLQVRQREQQDADRERCSATLGQLAVALGLPADALLGELHGRAGQLLHVLRGSGSRSDVLAHLTRTMENALAELKQATATLQGRIGTEAAND